MVSERKEQYRFMRLDDPSFDGLLTTVNTKISKRNVNMRNSRSQSTIIHYATLFRYCSYF